MIAKHKALARQNGYEIFSRPYEPNIWFFRSRNTVANTFDDECHVFYNTNVLGNSPKWELRIYKCTTDPGTYWLQNPMKPQGTAMKAPGQELHKYEIGLHRGSYYALVQKDDVYVTVIRDYNRNNILDFFNGVVDNKAQGINCHRAKKVGETFDVEEFSAGCMVFAIGEDFAEFMEICEFSRSLYGNSFTITLIDFRMERRLIARRVTGGIVLLTLGALGYLAHQNLLNQ